MSYPSTYVPKQPNTNYSGQTLDAYGRPYVDPVALQYGPCPMGGYHDIRYHYKTSHLCLAFLILPLFCFGRKEIVCKKCKKVLGEV